MTLVAGARVAARDPADAWDARQTFAGDVLPREGGRSRCHRPGVRCQVTGELQQASFAVRAGGPTGTIHLLTPEKSLPPKESLALTTAYTLGQAPKRDLVKRQRAGEEIVILPDEFSLFREGTLSGLHEDPTAPEGFAVRMVGETNEWATQWKIDHARVRPGATYEVSALVRFDLKGKEGGACTFGVYDTDMKTGACAGALAAADAKPGWQLVKFGRFKAEGQQFIWLAPAQNAENIGAVYVDRVFLRRVEGDRRSCPGASLGRLEHTGGCRHSAAARRKHARPGGPAACRPVDPAGRIPRALAKPGLSLRVLLRQIRKLPIGRNFLCLIYGNP